MERLKKWLKENNITGAQFAEKLGVAQSAVSMWLTGERFPSRENIQKIVELTGGEVQPNDFYKGE
jgi:transcriptional regulator with XRE-family HTH domain